MEFPMFSRWFARRDTHNQLSAMTNRQLADIGINRGDIKRIVSEM